MYVPSRDGSPEKTPHKRDFLDSCRGELVGIRGRYERIVLLGDLNILGPDHQPRYPFFTPFEYGF
jgi:exodeoxyribonuclease-3